MEPKDPKNPKDPQQTSEQERLFRQLSEGMQTVREGIQKQEEAKDLLRQLSPYEMYDLVEVRRGKQRTALKIYGISPRPDGYYYKFYLSDDNLNKWVFFAESSIVRIKRKNEHKKDKE